MNMLKTITILLFVMLLTRSASAQETTPETDQIYVTGVAWSSDGSRIAAVGIRQPSVQGYIRVFDAQTGATLYALDPNPGGFTSVAWSPDNRFLAIGGFDNAIWVVDVETQTHVGTLIGHQSTINAVSWNRDGSRLVSAGNWDGLTILWDMTNYRQTRIVEEANGGWFPFATAFNPRSDYIAVGADNGIRVYPSDNTSPHPLWQFNNISIAQVAWSHDGTRLAFGTMVYPSAINPDEKVFATVHIVDANTGSELNRFTVQDGTVYGLDWSPDDRQLATFSISGSVNVWDAATGVLLDSFPAADRYPVDIGFSPYGGRLAYGGVIPGNSATNAVSSSAAVAPMQDGAQALAGGAVQIVVPAPSTELLQSITERCAVQPAIERELATPLAANQLEAFVAEVEALPDTAMPPGCAADLVAVAEALGAQ